MPTWLWVAADLIRASKTGIVVGPENIGAIKKAVYNMYLKYKQKKLKITPVLPIIERFDRRKLTRDLAYILNEVSIDRIKTNECCDIKGMERKT